MGGDGVHSQFWITLADLVEEELGPVVEAARAGPRGSALPDEVADRLAETGSAVLWQGALIGAAAMDRETFLEIASKLYDQAELALATDHPTVELFRLVTPRGAA